MLLFVLMMLFIITSAFLGFLMTRVPFVPTYRGDIEFVVKKLGISSGDVFYDLGSGDGKVCFLVNELSGAHCVGFELTWWTHLLAKIKSLFYNPSQPPLMQRGGGSAVTSQNRGAPLFSKEGVGGVRFINRNFFKQSWSEANYIYGYLYPPLMGRVEQKFLADCKPGSIAIIRDFPFPNLKPINVYQMPKKHEIYIYKKV